MTLPTGENPGLRRIDARSVADQVTDEVRRSILSGALEPGENLSLRKLADRLGVSIIPVRDAIKNLHNEGLIVNPPGRSATVAPLDAEEFAGIYRIRRLLEPELARRACAALSDSELDRLYDVAADLGRPERSMEDIYDDHRAFHMALLAPAASSWDARILMQLWRAGERYIRIAFGLLDPDPLEHQRRREAHQLLVTAFRSRDPEVATTALAKHLEHNEALAIRALDGKWRQLPGVDNPQRV